MPLISDAYSESWIATITLETSFGKDPHSNVSRCTLLCQISEAILGKTEGDGIILFPAGWFNIGKERITEKVYNRIVSSFQPVLARYEPRRIILVIGIDGFQDNSGNDRDQVAIAVDKTGIVALARKFFPTEEDVDFCLENAPDHLALECRRTRIFELKGWEFFIAVCNDINAGHRTNLKKDGEFHFDVILNPIHKFEKGNSISDFLRKGLGLESAHYRCPVFGSVKFINHYQITPSWRTGIYWPFGAGISTGTKGTTIDRIGIDSQKFQLPAELENGLVTIELFTQIPGKIADLVKREGSFSGTNNSAINEKRPGKIMCDLISGSDQPVLLKKVVASFTQMNKFPDVKQTLSRKDQCRYSVTSWPRIDNKPTRSIFYEFNDWTEHGRNEFSTEMQFWSEAFDDIGARIRKMMNTFEKNVPGSPTLQWDSTSTRGFSRLKITYPLSEKPEIIAESMIILIAETYNVVNEWLMNMNYIR
jgi:hypothetical protein